MTDFQTGIITLMKSAFMEECGQLPKDFSLEAVESFAIKQNIVTLVYDGAVRCGFSTSNPVMQRLFHRYVKLVLHSERQQVEMERIFRHFDENKIDYIPLKGCNMKQLYPKPELRYMGDADILVRENQYDKIQEIMTGLGFAEKKANGYHYEWENSSLRVELHISLVSSKNSVFYGYWRDCWERATLVSGTRYMLLPEDDFLFQLTHFAKHYSGPGIGCRYLLDMWVFLRAHPNMNQTYLERELLRLQLTAFYQNLSKLIQVWFENDEIDDRSELMTDFLFSGSSWGSWQNEQLSWAARTKDCQSGTVVSPIMTKILPPLSSMKYRYPILQKCIFLLPVCWLWRIVQALFFDKRKRKAGIHFLTNVSSESVAQYRASIEYVGLFFEE